MKIIEKYNDKLSGVYDQASKKDWKAPEEFLKIIKKHIIPKLAVLDLGVGTGQIIEPFVKKDCKVYGIDISAKMLEKVKRKYKNLNVTKLDLEKNWSRLNKHKFDIISAIGVLEFVSNLQRIVRKVRKILNPQGKFCFTIEEYIKSHKVQKFKVSEIGRTDQKGKIPFILQAKVYRYTQKEVMDILSSNRFSIISKKRFIAYHRKNSIPVSYLIFLTELRNEK